jgi:hypothetical protein
MRQSRTLSSNTVIQLDHQAFNTQCDDEKCVSITQDQVQQKNFDRGVTEKKKPLKIEKKRIDKARILDSEK